MLIAQITDIHLGFDIDNPEEFNRQRLDATIAVLCAMKPLPDLLLATGDLIDRGDAESYHRLREAVAPCPFPVHFALGNHDERATFQEVFPEVPFADGFLQYEIDTGPLRFLILDTLEEGRHGGAFCQTRANWLNARLAEKTDKKTVIVQHHPPVETGIAWMNTHPDEPWVALLASCLDDRPNVVGMICGHIHRAASTQWMNMCVSTCPSTAPQVALDLRPIDPETPDGRDMIVAEPPAFGLHWWNGRELISHYMRVADFLTLARFDEKMQPLVRSLIAERPA